ncbi:hypothetical protein L1987_78418 [Smallanthus sonchifolius]|uniref:Uncharacterized protein n=1 Tax=Smallanthus sonchifolius TaxID=185202 RepID=A0ACB8ZCE6_9ASTR|nr:hypothetical protein L1987_78418 [Smallanthus sonchifolius]
MEQHRITSVRPKHDPGDAIHAIAHQRDKDHFQSRIKLMSCYCIDNYICNASGNPPKITTHLASLRFSTATLISPIPAPEGFPTFHFNVCPYEQLASLIGKREVFIGRLDGITDTTTSQDKPLARLRLTDIKLQLSATDATYIYLNTQQGDIVLLRNRACPTCKKKIYEKGATWSCGNHDNINEPNFMYCITTTIADETGTTTATFFNDAVIPLLGKECTEMFKEGYDNEFEIPKPLSNIISQTKSLQIQCEETPSRVSSQFTVSRLSTPTQELLLPDTTPPPSTSISQKESTTEPPTKQTTKMQLFNQTSMASQVDD